MLCQGLDSHWVILFHCFKILSKQLYERSIRFSSFRFIRIVSLSVNRINNTKKRSLIEIKYPNINDNKNVSFVFSSFDLSILDFNFLSKNLLVTKNPYKFHNI